MKLAYWVLLSLRVDVLIMVELCLKCVNITLVVNYTTRDWGLGEVAGATRKKSKNFIYKWYLKGDLLVKVLFTWFFFIIYLLKDDIILRSPALFHYNVQERLNNFVAIVINVKLKLDLWKVLYWGQKSSLFFVLFYLIKGNGQSLTPDSTGWI